MSLCDEFSSPALPGNGPASSCPQCRLDGGQFHPSHCDDSTVHTQAHEYIYIREKSEKQNKQL